MRCRIFSICLGWIAFFETIDSLTVIEERKGVTPEYQKSSKAKRCFHTALPESWFYSMPKSFSCSFQTHGRLVSSLVRESVRGAFPAMIASTIGGASRASRRKRRT